MCAPALESLSGPLSRISAAAAMNLQIHPDLARNVHYLSADGACPTVRHALGCYSAPRSSLFDLALRAPITQRSDLPHTVAP